jgi:hypothetical protein
MPVPPAPWPPSDRMRGLCSAQPGTARLPRRAGPSAADIAWGAGRTSTAPTRARSAPHHSFRSLARRLDGMVVLAPRAITTVDSSALTVAGLIGSSARSGGAAPEAGRLEGDLGRVFQRREHRGSDVHVDRVDELPEPVADTGEDQSDIQVVAAAVQVVVHQPNVSLRPDRDGPRPVDHASTATHFPCPCPMPRGKSEATVAYHTASAALVISSSTSVGRVAKEAWLVSSSMISRAGIR